MSFHHHSDSSSGPRLIASSPPRHRRLARRLFLPASLGLLLLFLLTLGSTLFSTPEAFASTRPPVVLKGSPSKPNQVSSTAGSTSSTRLYQPAAQGSAKPGKPQIITRNMHMSMKAASQVLQADKATSFLGSDGHFSLQIPPGAVTAQDLKDAAGSISLRVTQIAPASGSNAGGSGEFSLGTYLVQLVDAHGTLLSHGLRQPVIARYHLQKGEQTLYLDHAYVVLNGTLSAGVSTAQGVALPAAGKTLSSTLGPLQARATTLDPTTKTLTASPLLSTPSTSMSWDSDSPVATFGKPDPTSVDLNAGALSYDQPLSIPSGPGGLTPPVHLTYSSESVNEQHNASAAAGWVGEGWNLSLGEISWSEQNVTAGCKSCSATWDSSWQLSDAFGTSSQLIPPNVTTSTYYDDSPNSYCATGTAGATPCPILWHTATESYAKIYAYVGPVSIGQAQNPPCFRVWLPNGIMEEFGCTSDSLQYYYESGLGALVTGWYLDMITDPQGNQIHVTYQRDMASWKSPSSGVTYSYPRDVELSTVQYDSPGCLNAQTMCTGSSWAPLMQIAFTASHSVANSTNGTPTGCNTATNMRCDDPVDLSSSGGAAASLIQNTSVLNSIQTQVRTSGTGTWNTLHGYNLGYEQSGPTTSVDPASGLNRSTAGMLDLTRIQEVGSTGATALLYTGLDKSTTKSYAYMKAFDLSSKNVVVGPNTTLSYWVFPQSSATSNLVSGSNSSCVAIDMIFTDGTDLRDSGALDQHGNSMHPSGQCGHLTMDQWNLVTSTIGAVRNGKTINRINIGYDQPANTGGYRGYVDDIRLTNPGSSTPLFATTLESGDPQLSWTDTADGTLNVSGICCGLTGPQLETRQEFSAHTDGAALPLRTFTYTTQLNTYVNSFYHPTPTTKCGPSWNTGTGSGCLLWSQNYAGNDRFLSTISDGQGLAQSFSWNIAHNNSHGVNGGGTNNADPFYCNGKTGYPCNEADDSGWSHAVLSQESSTTTRLTQNGQGGAQTSSPITETTGYRYLLTYPLPAQQCSDCVAGMYWGDQNDADYLSYYNGTFMGFAQTTVNEPSGAVQVHQYYAGEGWGVYDTGKVACYTTAPCHNDPWWDLANAAHGQEYQTTQYDTDGSTLLQQTSTTYQATCPPAGVSGTPTYAGYSFDGQLISELSKNNPVAACEIQQTQQIDKTFDATSTPMTTTTSWTYDSYGRVTQEKTTGNGGTPATIVHNTAYVWNDGVTATQSSASGTYIIDPVASTNTEDGSGNRLQCNTTSYDGQSDATGQTSSLTGGQATSQTDYTGCGNASNSYATSGATTTTTAYNTFGDVVGSTDADANAGISGHTGCSVGSTHYTDCSAYDSTFDVFQTGATNALNQASTTSYANTNALFGYGTWPASTTDPNHQTTSSTYDSLGRMTSETLPAESSGNTTKQWTYTDWCVGTTSQAPCVEIDEIDRLNSTTTTTSRAFYDGEGRLVETRKPGPTTQDIVTYAYYDTAGRQIFKSNSYFVTAYMGVSGAAAYSIPDSTQPGTSTTYTNLRQSSVTDPNSHTTTTIESLTCGVAGTSDAGCYVQTTVQDASGHEAATFTGALGKVNYKQTYTGNSPSTYTRYALTTFAYDAAGDLVSTTSPDGSVATSTYDATGQVISQSDPDKGTSTATYDPNGNLIQSVDARGSAGTIYAGYDGLNRVLWRNSTNSATGAWVTYSYDSTTNGNNGIGQLTNESFTGSGNLSGSYAYTYDARGQQISSVTTVNGTGYIAQGTYNDAEQPLTETYPTGETITAGYSSTGWLTGMTTSAGGTTTLVSNVAYNGLAGAGGLISSLSLDNGTYTYSASYDTGLRLTSAGLTNTSSGTQLYQTQPTYDAVSNIIGVQTNVGGQTDTQQFCYDDLNRLTWSGTNGTPPCSGSTITAGTLTGAQYQQSDSYNIDGGLTTGPKGSYTYGDSNHPHAVTTTSSGYSATYDATGNMICRATSNSATCNGSSPTGQQLGYDAEGRLSSWQNQPTLPGQTVNYLYDGEGHRVAMQSTVSGTTTLTAYIGSIEEVQTTGSSTQATTFYTVGGKRVAADVNGTFYYFGYDALESQVAVLNTTGSLVGAQLYGPYGASRYNTGILPTSIGFTGQRADSVTGLDYYMARYYDPMAGVFLSADSVQGNVQGMEPYVYVMGNPETMVDPTGQFFYDPETGQAARILPNRKVVIWQYSPPMVTSYVPPRPVSSGGGYGIDVSGASTGNNVASTAYGAMSGRAYGIKSALKTYTKAANDGKPIRQSLRNFVKNITGDKKMTVERRVKGATNSIEEVEQGAKNS